MYIYRNLPFNLIWKFGWINFLIFIAWGNVVYWLHMQFEELTLSFSLVSTVGVGVAIYLSFKNSQSYDRQWEARKIWGEMLGKSKILANQVKVYVSRQEEAVYTTTQKEMVYRQLAFLNSCRLQLRKPSFHSRKYIGTLRSYYYGAPSENEWETEVGKFIDKGELQKVLSFPNRALRVLSLQYEALSELKTKAYIDEFRQMDMNKTIDACIESLGKCERLKNTPFPRQYAFFSKTFVWIFISIMPFGLLGQLSGVAGLENYIFFTVLNLLISWVFITMELVGDYSEDPFENFASDVPMTALCRNIEIELRAFLGEKELPARIQSKDGYLL